MKIALCHLETSMGPEEKNIEKIEKALKIAADQGADWVVTPETSLQGYYFYRNDKSKIDKVEVQPSNKLQKIIKLVKDNKLYLFLGAGELDPYDKKNYNSCLVFGPNGELIGRHRKIFNHGMGSEAWASPCDNLNPIQCGNIKVGALVCADAWFYEHLEGMTNKGAQVILVIAAWPATKECGDPLDNWKENAQKAGVPFILCNQTGLTPYMDMTIGQSVVIEDGKLLLSYSGNEAVLVFELDEEKLHSISREFKVFLL